VLKRCRLRHVHHSFSMDKKKDICTKFHFQSTAVEC
jgi:hypothetical protein